MTYTCYWVGPSPASSDPIWAEVVQAPATARYSLDGVSVVLKWVGSVPAHLPAGGVRYCDDPSAPGLAPIADLRALLGGPLWSDPNAFL